MTHVALLRGINVGGKNKLPMKTLGAIFTAAGAESVRTYIQSGNVLFEAPARLSVRIGPAVAAAIRSQFGYEIPVIIRTAAELAAVIAGNPFLKSADEAALHVGFLETTPTPAAEKLLDPDRSPGDSFRVIGREIFLHLPNGVARTKLTNAWFDSKLKTVSTFRNWRTVLKLADLAVAPNSADRAESAQIR